MKWIAFLLLGLAALVVVVAIIGSMLPRNHVASRTMRVNRRPEDVWAAVTQAAGSSDVPVDVIESRPPTRQVTRVKETEKKFGGTWTIVIAPTQPPSTGSGQAACTVTITEDGWVANPIFRFVSRFVIGHHATMDGILKRVAQAFDEEAVLTGE